MWLRSKTTSVIVELSMSVGVPQSARVCSSSSSAEALTEYDSDPESSRLLMKTLSELFGGQENKIIALTPNEVNTFIFDS